MNTRETSILAYKFIKENGLLSKNRFRVYDFLVNYGHSTRNKVARGLDMLPSAASARLGELRDLGVVRETGAYKDPHTRQKLLVFAVVDQLPVKKEKVIYKKCTHCHGRGKIPCIG